MALVVTLAWCWLGFVALVMLVYAARHLMLTLGRLLPQQRSAYHEILDSDMGPISLIIPMHNEGIVAERILDAIAESNFPKDRLEVFPVNDHSSDDTAQIIDAHAATHPYVHPLHRNEGARGKPAGLNDAMALTAHETTMIFDADYEPTGEVIGVLASAFIDPEVGTVMGRVVPNNTGTNVLTRLLDLERSGGYQVDQQARQAMDLMPQYGGTCGGFRRELVQNFGGFDPLVLAEDTHLTFEMVIRGYKVAYANMAECYEESPNSWLVRFKQLRRWSRGHTQVMMRLMPKVMRSRYLTPRQRFDAAMLLGIYLTPPILLSGLAANAVLFLSGSYLPIATILLSFMVVAYNAFGNFAPFYQIGAASLIDGSRQRMLLLPLLPAMFFFNGGAVSLGLMDALVDRITSRRPEWDKTKRAARPA